MSLQFFAGAKAKQIKPRHYKKPEEVLSDIYLTPLQKSLVLEAMLSEAEDEMDEGVKFRRYKEKIGEAQVRLKNQLF